MLSESDIKEFQQMYLEETGEELSFAEAREAAEKGIALFRAIYRPLPAQHKGQDLKP